jgi:hypothetical protein
VVAAAFAGRVLASAACALGCDAGIAAATKRRTHTRARLTAKQLMKIPG